VADSIDITSAHCALSSAARMGMATQDHGAEYGEGEFPDARQVESSTEVWMEQELAELESVLQRAAGALSGLLLRSSARVLQEEDSEEERAGANSGTVVDPQCADNVHGCFDEGEDNVGGAAVGAAAAQNLTASFHEPGPAAVTLPSDSPVTVRREKEKRLAPLLRLAGGRVCRCPQFCD
jgi:hypothetical protein